MDLCLEGKRALVCASSRGLGFACAAALAGEGADVVLNGREAAALGRAADRIVGSTGRRPLTVAADLETATGRAALLSACAAPDILVTNNRGPEPRPIDRLSGAHLEQALTMNLSAPFELMRAIAPGMAERRFGRIINITSIAVMMPIAGLEASSAARAALSALAVGLARRFAAEGVTVNNLLPGYFATERLAEVFEAAARRTGGSADDARRRQAAGIPAGRFGDPPELGALCAFLASPLAAYTTGQNFLVDGGLCDRIF
ncbi:MAG TPA: SDR family oxidoreductase [Caulobacteraceae bacterium]|nr:SDR family oxidoreductase [Caulobacteraceae bacterium]